MSVPAIESRRQNGAALAIVLWSLAIIGAVVAGFFARSLVEAAEARRLQEETRARALAQAGVACFLQRFLADEDELDTAAEAWFCTEGQALPSFTEGTVDVRVTDCGSRINLNLAGPETLALLFDGDPAPLAALLDWVDADSEPRPDGAERDYYQGQSPPVLPADGFLRCPEEVFLIRGLEEYRERIEQETTIYGPANPNLIAAEAWEKILLEAGLSQWEAELLAGQFAVEKEKAAKERRVPFERVDALRNLPGLTGRTLDLIAPFLIFRGQVNPNLAGETALRAALSQLGLAPEEKLQALLEAREAAPFQDLQALRSLLDGNESAWKREYLGQVFTLETTLVQVEAVGRTKSGAACRLVAVIERYHPPLESQHWQARFLSWREYPAGGSAGQ